jgi:CHAD domain-containing protein
MRRKLQKKVEKFDARLEAAVKSDKPGPMHRLRIAAKQLRYTCELLENAVEAAPPLLAELTPLQESLGELHDADVRVELLRRHGRKALLREEQEVRARLARLVEKELGRWQARGVSRAAQ